VFGVAVQDTTIQIVERDTMRYATCLCGFSLSVTIGGLNRGNYIANIYRNNKYLQDTIPRYIGSIRFTILEGGILSAVSRTYQSACSPVAVPPIQQLPKAFALYENFPNPFNPTTTIRYDLPTSSFVRLTVFNILGEPIATLVNGIEHAGERSVLFDASNLSSGIYFYRLQSNEYTKTMKMIVAK
jgi:hypothetical protein